MTHLTLDQAIDTVIAVGYLKPELAHERYRPFIEYEIKLGRKPHQNELLEAAFTEDCVQHLGDKGVGLLCSAIGVANFGGEDEPDWPEDPAGEHWQGRPPRSGKHFIDGSRQAPYGGFGIAHFDSGSLRDCYREWGYPSGGRQRRRYWEDPDNHFNAVLKGPYREEFLDWADDLTDLNKRGLEFGRWSIRYWLRKYWEPSWAAYPLPEVFVASADGHQSAPWRWLDRVKAATMAARIRNSAKGWGKRWAEEGLTGEQLAEKYIEAKRDKRGESSAKRTERQVAYVQRVWALVEWARIKPVDT